MGGVHVEAGGPSCLLGGGGGWWPSGPVTGGYSPGPEYGGPLLTGGPWAGGAWGPLGPGLGPGKLCNSLVSTTSNNNKTKQRFGASVTDIRLPGHDQNCFTVQILSFDFRTFLNKTITLLGSCNDKHCRHSTNFKLFDEKKVTMKCKVCVQPSSRAYMDFYFDGKLKQF